MKGFILLLSFLATATLSGGVPLQYSDKLPRKKRSDSKIVFESSSSEEDFGGSQRHYSKSSFHSPALGSFDPQIRLQRGEFPKRVYVTNPRFPKLNAFPFLGGFGGKGNFGPGFGGTGFGGKCKGIYCDGHRPGFNNFGGFGGAASNSASQSFSTGNGGFSGSASNAASQSFNTGGFGGSSSSAASQSFSTGSGGFSGSASHASASSSSFGGPFGSGSLSHSSASSNSFSGK